MALSFTAAKIKRSGGPYMFVEFAVVLDGSSTTGNLDLPTGFPPLQAQAPSLSSGTPGDYDAIGPISDVSYVNSLGGTAAAGITVSKLIPGTDPATELAVTVSGAGTSGHTVKVLALVPDTF